MASEIKPGQIWADDDPRNQGRLLEVVSIGETHVQLRETVDRVGNPSDRLSKVQIRRMKPGSTGYRLVQDVE